MFDVVVVGASLSGLQAAYSVLQTGLSIVVVEDWDRVGGKIWSVPLASGRGHADLGAAWINDKIQKLISNDVRKFDLAAVKQILEGTAVMQVDHDSRTEFSFGITPEFFTEEKKDLELIRHHIQSTSLKREAPKSEDDILPLDQYVRKLSALLTTAAMINLWVRIMHGVESSQESAAFFIDYCRRNGGLFPIRADDHTGGNYQHFHGGTQAIAKGIAQLIGANNIHLSAPVASIENHQTHATVIMTNNRHFVGGKVIISVPSAMLRNLKTTLALPQRVRDVTNSSRLGHYNKAIVCYDWPWWRDLGYNGFFMGYTRPVALARDTGVDEIRHYALTCFINGNFEEESSELYPHERRGLVIKQVGKVFNADVNSEAFRPIEVFYQIWKHERFSKGALAPITEIGHYTEYADVYGKPVGSIHFVGTKYSIEWK